MAEEDLSEAISLRVTPEDRETLDSLAARFPLKAMTIARIALRLGMSEIAKNPAALFAAGTAEESPTPKRRPSKK